MAAERGLVATLIKGILDALTSRPDAKSGPRRTGANSDTVAAARRRASVDASAGGFAGSDASGGATATIEIDPPAASGLVIGYAPDRDGDPDAGEVVWTWVPYAEHDGRGKDRPVLVIGRQRGDRVFAVRLTSKSHDGDRDFFSIGAGPWDAQGRPSWIDIEQVYSVHRDGMRREASALDLPRFTRVAQALRRRYGWRIEGDPPQR